MLCARERVGGDRDERVRAVWQKQHEAAGKQMFGLCVDLKGFYIKASAALPTNVHVHRPLRFFRRGAATGLSPAFACVLRPEPGQSVRLQVRRNSSVTGSILPSGDPS